MKSPDMLRSIQAHAGSEKSALYDGERVWSYAELWNSAVTVADKLPRLGAHSARPVVVDAKKSAGAIAMILGCGMAGVPAVLVSADLGRSAVNVLLERTGSTHLLGLDAEPEPGGPVRMRSETTGLPEAAGRAGAMLGGAPLVLTTSGSTGSPKVVPLSRAGVERFVAWAAETFDIRSGTVVLNYAPLNFDLTLLDIWATLTAGGIVVLVEHDRAVDGAHLAALVDTHRVEVAQAVPMCFRLLTEQDRMLESVRHVITTGDVLPSAVLVRFPAMFPNAAVHNIYGCTETNDSVMHTVTDFDTAASLPIGVPIDGVRALLVDGNDAEIHGPGIGELLVSTPFQAHGYLDQELTARRFVTGIAGSADTLYRTGDIVRRDAEGLLYLHGRNDFNVKVRGVRTNVHEVEYVLEQHPAVAEVAVVAIPDPEAGHRLHAAVRSTYGVNSLVLRSHCARSLPLTAIPSTFEIQKSALPRTSTGKIDRNAIRRPRQEIRTANV